MSDELGRGFRRVAANYLQLGGSVLLGVLLVPMLLKALGTEGFGLVALLGATVGVASMFEAIVRRSMIRELGAVFHGREPGAFPVVYNSALIVSLMMAGFAVLTFAGLILLVPLFKIPASLLPAARLFVAAQGVRNALGIAASPCLNMYLVKERYLAWNLLTLGRFAANAGAALIVLLWAQPVPRAIVAYGVLGAGLSVAVSLAATVALAAGDRRLVPRPRLATRSAMREVLSMGGWNSLVVIAGDLQLPANGILMNLFFGLPGSALFDPSVRLGGYLRRMVKGVTRGSDAVAARLSATTGDGDKLRQLLRTTTRLHAIVGLPGAAAAWILAAPIIELWIGSRIDQRLVPLADVVLLTRILIFAFLCRSIADGWVFLLYGAGHVRRFAPLVVAGGVVNIPLAIGLIRLLPEGISFAGPALAYAVMNLGVNFLLVPVVSFPALDARLGETFGALLRPLACALLSAPVLLVAVGDGAGAWGLIGGLSAFSAVYALLTLLLAVSAAERVALVGAVRARLGL